MTNTHTLRQGAMGAAAATLTALLFAKLINNDPSENGGAGALLVLGAIVAAVGAFLFIRVIPRAIEAGPAPAARRAAITGVLRPPLRSCSGAVCRSCSARRPSS